MTVMCTQCVCVMCVCWSDNRITTPCAAMLSFEESLAAMVETTAVQSLQVSAVARARRAEVKMNAFMVDGGQHHIISPFHHHYVIKKGTDTFIVED